MASQAQIIIAGFPSTDFVPGAYGEVKYGAGATSAASIPLKLLVVGMKASNTSGTSTQDQNVDQVPDVATADTLYGIGGQLARACQAALQIQGVNVYGAPVAVPSGATQATLVLNVLAATQTRAGTLSIRIAGIAIQVSIGATDTAATIATNIAAQINSTLRLPATASVSSANVTVTIITPGTSGNVYNCYVDLSQCAGVTVSPYGATWVATTAYTVGQFTVPTTANGYYYKCTTAGTSASSQPTWPTTLGTTVTDGSVVWTCWGQVLTGGVTTFANGSGVENVTNVLAVIKNQQYDRIALCHNDATNLGLWVTQVTAQAGALSLLLQHVIAGTNAAQSAATTLATVTLNNPRFQLLWYLNSETHFSEFTSVFASLRVQAEQTDPASSYDGVVLPGVAPQSQKQDWASHGTLVSCLNNGVTPVTTVNNQPQIVRSITTYSLNGTIPTYSTLDTAAAVVPDFVLKGLLLYWITVFKPGNPRLGPDLPDGARPYPSGVGYPALWTSCATSVLRDYEQGKIGSAPVAPIILNVDGNLPVSVWDPVAKRIMSAVTVIPAYADHQIGVSVRQGN